MKWTLIIIGVSLASFIMGAAITARRLSKVFFNNLLTFLRKKEYTHEEIVEFLNEFEKFF